MDGVEAWRQQRTTLGHLRDNLENARMAEFVFSPSSKAAEAFTEHLTALTLDHEAQAHPRRRKRQAQAYKDFRRAIAAFAADLLHHSQFEEAAGFFYRGSNRDDLAETLVSSRSFEHLSEFWPEMGLMERTSFFIAREDFEGTVQELHLARARRFRATPKLLGLAADFDISADAIQHHFEKQMQRIRPITVRSEEVTSFRKKISRNLKLKGPKVDAEAQRVAEINAILACSGFDLKEVPWVYRLFHRGNFSDFDFNMGGRLYCRSADNWQQMRPAQRRQITWRGEATVELDVRASHLFILYALLGFRLSYDTDPYHLSGVERDVVKGLFSAITGKGTIPQRWPKRLGEDYLAATGNKVSSVYRLKEVISALLAKHPVLDDVRPNELDWAKLQFEESECFMVALTRLGKQYDVPALPIFDSLIVPQRHQEVALSVLKEAYKDRFGFTPEVRVK